MKGVRLPSPAMVVAMLALLVALSGTAVAAGIVPKAKVALNALKLQGKTAAQVAALAPAPTSVGGLVAPRPGGLVVWPPVRSDLPWPGMPAKKGDWRRLRSASHSYSPDPPGSDGASWKVRLRTSPTYTAQSGTLFAACIA
jgi:hypothetical protein